MAPVRSITWKTGLVAALTLTLSSTASAAEPETDELPVLHRSRDILKHIDDLPEEPGWITRHVTLDLDSGVRYTRTLRRGDRAIQMRVKGPVYRGTMRKTRYGLNFEVKF